MARFRNRTDAARRLVQPLESLRGAEPLVVGVPPHGVAMGRVLAEALDGDLDVVLTNRLLAPDDPGVVIGSVSQTGRVHVNYVADLLDVRPEWIAEQAIREVRALERRARIYRRQEVPIRDRTVVLVDDGSSTGATLLTAVDALRDGGAARIVVAVPIIGQEAASRVADVADELVCLESPRRVQEVASWYREYEPVADERAANTLREYQSGRGVPA